MARQGKHEQAGELLKRLYDAGLTTARVRAQLGLTNLASGNVADALSDLEAATFMSEGKPTSAGLYAAAVHIQERNLQQATRLLERLLSTAPDNPTYNNFAGAIQVMSGHRKEPRKYFMRALSADPDFQPARANLAELARQAGNLATAETEYRQILASDTNSITAIRGLAELALERADYPEAIDRLAQIKRIDRSLIADRLVLAKTLITLKRFDDAQDELGELRAEFVDNWQVLLLSAGLEKASDAETLLEAALTARNFPEKEVARRALSSLRTTQSWQSR